VAVKQLFSSDETEFRKESTILKALGPKNHPHLIKLLTTYEMGKKYHLMFPYANANLRKYWEDHPFPGFDGDTVLWSLKQMSGIAKGLQLIHDFRVTVPLSVPGAGTIDIRLGKGKGLGQLKVEKGEQWFGRHGDIKPENVLWFAKDHYSLTRTIWASCRLPISGWDVFTAETPDQVLTQRQLFLPQHTSHPSAR
jgi:serine/threonine protein kinase